MQEIESKSATFPRKLTPEHDRQQVSEVPPSPAISLRYYGFARRRNELNRVFLQDNGSVFIAKSGDIVESRYKIVQISQNGIVVDDMLSNYRYHLAVK
jgi:hypothetical protein